MASATATFGNNVPRASRSAAAAFFARMDVWACGGDNGGGGDVFALAATRADVGRRD